MLYKKDADDPVWFALKSSESLKINLNATVANFLNLPRDACLLIKSVGVYKRESFYKREGAFHCIHNREFSI